MHDLFSTPAVPIFVGTVLLFVFGFQEWKTYRVPNLWVFGSLFAALAFAIVASLVVPDRSGGVASSFVGMMIGGAVLLPVYAKGMLGAGCVKAQAAFGAWVGAALPFGQCVKIVAISSLVAMLFAAAMCYLLYLKRKAESQDSGFVVHAQLPLSLGTLLGLVVAILV